MTIGTSVVPFSISTSSGWYSDGSPGDDFLGVVVGLDNVVLGNSAFYNGGLTSGLGVFPATDLITVDGVTFGLPLIYPEFWTITYVPEPSAAPLLAVAGLLLLLFGAGWPYSLQTHGDVGTEGE